MSVLLVLVVLLTSSILVGGVLLPVGGFWLLTELGSRKSKWFAVLSGICVLLSAGWYWVGYEYALTYQSADYFWGVLACSLAVLASAVGLLIGGRSVPWMRIAGCWLFVLWAFTYAFPWMGEYI